MTTEEKIKKLKEEISVLEIKLENEKQNPKKYLLELLGNELAVKIDIEKFPNSVFYFKGDNLLLELEKSSDIIYLWCSYIKIWNPISNKFSLEFPEIQQLIKETVEEHFKMRGVTPKFLTDTTDKMVEEHFKKNN